MSHRLVSRPPAIPLQFPPGCSLARCPFFDVGYFKLKPKAAAVPATIPGCAGFSSNALLGVTILSKPRNTHTHHMHAENILLPRTRGAWSLRAVHVPPWTINRHDTLPRNFHKQYHVRRPRSQNRFQDSPIDSPTTSGTRTRTTSFTILRCKNRACAPTYAPSFETTTGLRLTLAPPAAGAT